MSKYHRIHGISKDPTTHNYMLVLDYESENFDQFLCSNCKTKELFFDWCNYCKIEHFNSNYGNIPSDNDDLNIILKSNYCESNKVSEFIEWISYTSFIDVTFINKGGFSKVYGALWLDNKIDKWDHINTEWKR